MAEHGIAQTLQSLEVPTSLSLDQSVDINALLTPPDSGAESTASSSPSIPGQPPSTPVPSQSQALVPTPKKASSMPTKSPAQAPAAPTHVSPLQLSRRPIPARSPLDRVRAGGVRKSGVRRTPVIDRLRRDTRYANDRLASMAQLLHATVGQYRRAMEGQLQLNQTVVELTHMADEMRPFLVPWCEGEEDSLASSEDDENKEN